MESGRYTSFMLTTFFVFVSMHTVCIDGACVAWEDSVIV